MVRHVTGIPGAVHNCKDRKLYVAVFGKELSEHKGKLKRLHESSGRPWRPPSPASGESGFIDLRKPRCYRRMEKNLPKKTLAEKENQWLMSARLRLR